MHVFVCASMCEFRGRNSFKGRGEGGGGGGGGGEGGKNVQPGKNSIFLKKGKMVISVRNRKFSRSRMTKRTSLLNLSHEI